MLLTVRSGNPGLARHRLLLLASAALLFMLGLVMIFDTSSAEIIDHALPRNTHDALIKQLIYALLGCGVGYLVWLGGYRLFLATSPLWLILLTIALVLVFVPGVGYAANGSRRWIGLAGYTIQPSEFVKYVVPAFFIYSLSRTEAAALSFPRFLSLIGWVAIPMGLILIEPNHGSVGVIGVTLALLCFLCGVRLKYWALPLACLALVGLLLAAHTPYVQARLRVYLHPELDLKGKGHQPFQAKIAAGSGGLFGRGPGQSLQKLSYLPEAQNDYIAAIYAEEYGFVGMLLLIGLYMVIAYAGVGIALQAAEPSGYYLAMVATFLLCFQAFLNLGVVSGLLPSTGLNLPLFSQGGSSLIANLMGLGLLLSINNEEVAA